MKLLLCTRVQGHHLEVIKKIAREISTIFMCIDTTIDTSKRHS